MKWCANYTDGTQLMQWEGDKENRYLDIDRDKLNSFSLYDDEDKLILVVSIERATQKLIYRKRTFWKPMMPVGQQHEYVWLVGWHENINGTSIKAICYIYEDGHIEFSGAKDDCELIPCEQ